MAQRRVVSGRTIAAGGVVLLQLVLCLAVLLVPMGDDPHRAPVGIVAPPIVATSLAEQADALEGRPVQAEASTSARAARADVEHGRIVAALVVDLRTNSATLLVSSAQGDDVVEAVTRVAGALAGPFAAEVTVRDIAPMPAGSAGRAGLLAAVAAAVVAGLTIAVALTWLRGPVADTSREARRRMVVGAGVSSVASLVVAVLASREVGGEVASWWLCSVLAAMATCAATMALEGVLGAAGIGVVTTVFVLTAAPLARAGHQLLLPAPWGEAGQWLPLGAGSDAAGQIAFFDGAGVSRPLVVLLAWLVVSLVALAIARRERRRAGVVWSDVATPR